jgi:hypothetical protein
MTIFWKLYEIPVSEFVNKVLLGHSCTHSFVNDCSHAAIAEVSSCNRHLKTPSPKPKIVTVVPSTEKVWAQC